MLCKNTPNLKGIGISNPEDWKHPTLVSFDPKPFADHDVDIEIEACGICGSDFHVAAGDWGPVPKNQILGHEVIGHVVKVGPKCHTGIKVGDRVGVGAQVLACLECDRCKSDNEQYCPIDRVWTIVSPYKDGYIAQGGFASHIRVHEHFAIPIPKNIPSPLAAPLLCGGITVFSPLSRNGCGPGKKVGIIGVGGIGHMGILLAKAMGAEVYAFSRGQSKKEDSLKLGADHYIATSEDENWSEKYFNTLDLIVICSSSLTGVDLDKVVNVMKIGGSIVSIAAPDASERLVLQPLGLMGVSISSSGVGSRKEIEELLKLVSEKDIKIWVEELPISEEGVNEAFTRMEKGDVKYRFTLVDYDKEF
ncbi:AHL_G0043900.mRNA.1.CDS.1 [Saccharomyces cerevisiae]|nr:AHL_G0043900.mRNA.1.CDS.1 [Saccharomyces cerevisiae]CAI6852427.1 AHL_G0043900.mRNA.1.CDS.1 [Saccharomyces cerevisiae]